MANDNPFTTPGSAQANRNLRAARRAEREERAQARRDREQAARVRANSQVLPSGLTAEQTAQAVEFIRNGVSTADVNTFIQTSAALNRTASTPTAAGTGNS